MSRRTNPVKGTTVALYAAGALAVGGLGFLVWKSRKKTLLDQVADVLSTLPPVDPGADPADAARGYVSALWTTPPMTQDQFPKRGDVASDYVKTLPVTKIQTFGPFTKGQKMPGVAALSPSPDFVLIINPAGIIIDGPLRGWPRCRRSIRPRRTRRMAT